MRERFFRALGQAVCRWPWWIAGVLLLIVAAAGLYAYRSLDFKTSRSDLIGRDSEYWRLYSEYATEFRAEEDYLVVVESDQPQQNRQAIDALAAAFLAPANNPNPADSRHAQTFEPADVFERVEYRALEPWFLYYLSTNDLVQIRDSLRDFNQLVAILQHQPRVATFLGSMNQMLGQMALESDAKRRDMEAFLPTVTGIVRQMGQFDATPETWPLLSPWAGAFFSEEMVSEAEAQMKWEGYHVFKNGHMYVMIVHPRLTGEVAAPDHHAATIPKIRRILNEVRPQFPGLRITLTGEPVLDTDEMVVSERDAIRSSVLTVILIGIVVLAGFRDWLRMSLSILCLLQVIVLSMGYTTLVIGHLNIITITFAVMILGLGEDLGVQFISRFEEELQKGASRYDAVRAALCSAGPSIVTAGVTNAAAFFAMALSGFRGVTELGVIAGGGMLLATGAMLVLLPSLIMAVRRRREPTPTLAKAQASAAEAFLLRHPHVTVTVGVAFTIAALWLGWRVEFDYNVLNLQSRGLESVDTELRLLRADAESTIYAAVVSDSLPETRQLHHRLEKLPVVASVHSIAELIPEEQEPKVEIIREIRKRVGDVKFELVPFQTDDVTSVQRALGSLRVRASQLEREARDRHDASAEKVFKPLVETVQTTRDKIAAMDPAAAARALGEYERRFFTDLQVQLQLLEHQADRPMTVADVPPDLRRVLVGKTGKFLIRVFPRENIWEREPLEEFVREVHNCAPKATGTPMGLYEFVDILQKGYIKAAIWAFFVIAIMVLVDLRGVFATILTLLPIVVGMIWMIGAMVMFGIKFNPANILTLPLMVGIGVAYGIYIVRRYREDGEPTIWAKSTGRAVMLSALTSIIAFASLLIGAHRGIGSLGLVMCLGTGGCLIASLTIVPALLEFARRKGWKV